MNIAEAVRIPGNKVTLEGLQHMMQKRLCNVDHKPGCVTQRFFLWLTDLGSELVLSLGRIECCCWTRHCLPALNSYPKDGSWVKVASLSSVISGELWSSS